MSSRKSKWLVHIPLNHELVIYNLTPVQPTPPFFICPEARNLLDFEMLVYLAFLIFVFWPANHKIFTTRPFEGFANLWAELPSASPVL